MRFPGDFKVQLVRLNDTAYDEVRDDKERYVVAEPGQTFRVKVQPPPALLRRYSYIQVSLHLDGHSPGVCRHLTHADPSYQFKGWVRTVKGQQQYAPFEFGDAQQQAGASGTMGRPSSPGSKIGLVTVHFHAASLDHVRSGAARTHSEGDWKEAGKTGLKDGKKWFLQPSANTKVGKLNNDRVHWSNHKFIQGQLLFKAELRMETCPVLMLRKILNPEKPRHQAIIDRLTGAADSSSDDDSDDQPSVHRVKPEQVARQSQPHASTLTHATSPVRVKPEPQALRKRKRKAALPNPNVLDLTASGSDRSTSEPAELQANVCDLTGKADFPRWSIRPTQRVKIE